MEWFKWVILLTFLNISQTEKTSSFQCDSSNDCSCTPTLPDVYEFHCSDFNTNVVIRIEPKIKYVHVQCTNDVDWDTKQLPYFNIDYVNHLSFLQCSIPTRSFSDVMHKMRINNTKVFIFEYSPDFTNTTVTSTYFQDLNNLHKLSLNRNDIQHIEENAFEFLNQLLELDLKFNKIHLSTRLFKNLQHLKLLDLSDNELDELPSGLLENLKNLEVLYMWSNRFTSITGSMFVGLEKLQLLELSRNHIQNISWDSFHNLKDLKIISLSGNKLKSIPNNLFVNNKLLEKIFLKENPELAEIPNNLFSNLTNLKSLTLNNCKLKGLPAEAFEGLTRLQNLSLQMNKIEYLPRDVFKFLINVEDINLSYNQISDFSDDVFSSTIKIKRLNLENNLLAKIGLMPFNHLDKLEVLNLKDNRIISIDGHAFQTLSNLKQLDLSNNDFDLPKLVLLFGRNQELRILNLSNNSITGITEDIRLSLLQLEQLDLSYNQITYIKFADVFTAAHPIIIDLSYNDITTVDFTYAEIQAKNQGYQDAISSNSGNRVVYLNGNPIACDCGVYEFVQYFERIIDPMVPTLVTIKANDLTCASPPDLVGVNVKDLKSRHLVCSLEQLGIEEKFTEVCEYGFRPWDKSLIIDCMENNLTKAPRLEYPKEAFFNQTEVYLQRNYLTEGPNENMGYENVTMLFLSYNEISKVPWIPPRLKVLELDHNNLTHLNDSVLTILNKTSCTNITLGNNPWTCDCSIANFIHFLVISNIHNKDVDMNAITCFENDKHVIKLNIEEICPSTKTLYIILGILLFSIALIVAVLYALYYRFQQEIKVWLFAHNLCLWFVCEEELDKHKKYDAFISYSHKDEDFVIKELQPTLEQGSHPYKLCLHVRDWIAGEFISKQIVTSVTESRRTIVILSRNFLESEWGKMEFRTAHKQALQDGRARVILILYGDIDIERDLDEEFKAYICTNTYVKWGDPWFWNKLKYALPHSPVQIEKQIKKHQNIMVAINEKLDKLDLINGSSTPNPESTPPVVNVDPLLLKDKSVNFRSSQSLTPPAESGENPLLITENK